MVYVLIIVWRCLRFMQLKHVQSNKSRKLCYQEYKNAMFGIILHGLTTSWFLITRPEVSTCHCWMTGENLPVIEKISSNFFESFFFLDYFHDYCVYMEFPCRMDNNSPNNKTPWVDKFRVKFVNFERPSASKYILTKFVEKAGSWK